MKFVLLFTTAWLLSPVLGDGHSLCACQINTNSHTLDQATEACCSRVGGQLTSDRLPATGGIKYAGYYCQGNDISGDQFYSCCKTNGGQDSTCPQ
ncbi:hypothetical protein F5X96DRAFT_443013 [Biscogniauxia mediterranea]|nr:hypothetical protein F5X96DRAFT_443013 [Biscogniauxia mediterranea]